MFNITFHIYLALEALFHYSLLTITRIGVVNEHTLINTALLHILIVIINKNLAITKEKQKFFSVFSYTMIKDQNMD